MHSNDGAERDPLLEGWTVKYGAAQVEVELEGSDARASNAPAGRKRYVVMLMTMLGQMMMYVTRFAMPSAIGANSQQIQVCPAKIRIVLLGGMQCHFEWSDEVEGAALSAFFWGNILLMIPAGWIVTEYGAALIFPIGMVALVARSLRIQSSYSCV